MRDIASHWGRVYQTTMWRHFMPTRMIDTKNKSKPNHSRKHGEIGYVTLLEGVQNDPATVYYSTAIPWEIKYDQQSHLQTKLK